MHMHSKLRTPINRDLGFRIPIVDAQPSRVRTPSPAPRILLILLPQVDLNWWCVNAPVTSVSQGFSTCRCTPGSQTMLQDF